MNIKDMDLNLLKSLKLLMDEKNVSEAAKKADITQPAMSKNLKKIREILKDDILKAKGKEYVLTEKAEHLLPRIDKILKDLELVMQPCSEYNPKEENSIIKIVSSDYANVLYLPKIIERLSKYPNVKLEVYSPQEQDLNKLKDEDVDFYLGIGNASLLPESLIVKKIYGEEFISAICKNHPLKDKNVTVEDYVAYPHMLISNLNLNMGKVNMKYSRGVIDEQLNSLGLKREVNLVIPHFTTGPLLLQKTNYILTAPKSIIEYYENLIDIKTFEPPVKNIKSDFYLAWYPGSTDKRVNSWFKKEIIDKIP